MNKKHFRKFKQRRARVSDEPVIPKHQPTGNNLAGAIEFMTGELLEVRAADNAPRLCVLCRKFFLTEEFRAENILGFLAAVPLPAANQQQGNEYFVHARHLLDRNQKPLPSYDLNLKKIRESIRGTELEILEEKIRAAVEKNWQENWRPFVCDRQGNLDAEKLKREFFQYSRLKIQAAEVYSYLTNGLLSEPDCAAEKVISLAEEIHLREIISAVEETTIEDFSK